MGLFSVVLGQMEQYSWKGYTMNWKEMRWCIQIKGTEASRVAGHDMLNQATQKESRGVLSVLVMK